MKVAELRAMLEKFDSDLLVVVDGYESGFAESIVVQELGIAENANGTHDGIYGRHGYPAYVRKPVTRQALFIGEGRCIPERCDDEEPVNHEEGPA